MIIPLFPINILKRSITVDWNTEAVMARLDQEFQAQLNGADVHRHLHKEQVFAPIVNFMNECVAEYWNVLEHNPQFPIEMYQLWANCFSKNDLRPHDLDNDAPANVTAVFYVRKDSPDMGNIYFGNPNELILSTQPQTLERRHKKKHADVDAVTGDVICFPSWLPHGIRQNLTDTPRISMAATYQLKGLDFFKRLTKPGTNT